MNKIILFGFGVVFLFVLSSQAFAVNITAGKDIGPNGNITWYMLNNINFSVKIVASREGNYSITGTTRRTENSGSGGPNVLHNKTSELYPGDVIDLNITNSGNTNRDVLFLIKPQLFYNKTGITYNITNTNANSTSCSIISNTTSLAQVDCIIVNSDIIGTFSYIADSAVSQFFMFHEIKSNTTTSLIAVGHSPYFDFDVSSDSGVESQDEYKAIVNSSQYGAGTEEQITKEGSIVCDTQSLPNEVDLQKCAANDSFTIKQHLGTGISGLDLFIGGSVEFTNKVKIEFQEGFANPSTDTDGKREVPPEQIDITSPDLNNKNDIMFVLKIADGNLTQAGARFKKFFGVAYGNTNNELGKSATEIIPGRSFKFDNLAVIDSINGSTLKNASDYHGLNITSVLSNTGTLDLTNINITCTMTHSDGTIAASDNFLINITHTEPAKKMQCAGIVNTNNSIYYGNYTIAWTANTSLVSETAAQNFTILTDYEGVATATIGGGGLAIHYMDVIVA